MIKYTTTMLLLVFAMLLFFTLKPVPNVSINNCKQVQGYVENIYEAGTKDIIFQLKNNEVKYYINRGFELANFKTIHKKTKNSSLKIRKDYIKIK